MIGTIIQARLGSERLPRKVMMDMPRGSGMSVLERVYLGVKSARLAGTIAVTTPDREIARWCRNNRINCNLHTGERNVLKEFYDTAYQFAINPIIRITADCPLIFGREIDRVVEFFFKNDYDYVYNHHDEEGDKGDGLDVEVFTFEALCSAKDNAEKDEHVTTWIRKNCKTGRLNSLDIKSKSLNTQEDYEYLSDNWGELVCQFTKPVTELLGVKG